MKSYKLSHEVKDNNHIILDIGFCYTKIGVSGENNPRIIIETPNILFKGLKDCKNY